MNHAHQQLAFDLLSPPSISEFFRRLFTTDFMPHGHCYFWRPEILWLHVGSDFVIALSYFSIPVALLYFIRRRRDMVFQWAFVAFGAFILLCGFTHLMSVWTTWHGTYRLEGLVKFATALASVLTAVFLWPLIPKALAIPSPKQLHEANDKLAETNRRLVENERLKDEFTANISHELRTPLNLILTPAESLLAGTYGELTRKQKETVGIVHNNAVRLLQMVNGLLDFARLEANRLKPVYQDTDVSRLTQAIVHDFIPLAKKKGLRLGGAAMTQERAVVSTDPHLFERIVFNLLSNAVKFTEKGEIQVSLEVESDFLTVTVKDTGIGISGGDRELLFQRFRQLEGSATRRFEGTGLGLSLVKEFAELLGGEVRVESEPGRGSRFTVRLPVKPGSGSSEVVTLPKSSAAFHPAPAPVPAAVTLPPDAPKILIAEDNEELTSFIFSLLDWKYQVRHAADGNAALEMISEWKPDLVISDVMMPGLDGFALCRRIKEDPRNESTAVILLTALTHREALLKGWESGADEYLFKPFHPKELETRVSTILRNARARQAAKRALETANEALERRVEERTLEIQAKNEELQRINRELEEFNYLAAHDLQEPLRTISTMADLVNLQSRGALDRESTQYLNFISEGARRAQRLIRELLEYQRGGRQKLEKSKVSSYEVLLEVLSSLSTHINESGAEITWDNMPAVEANRRQLSEIFQNLIDNAVKFRKPEGVPKIHVSAERRENEWVFSFRDNGIGIAPEFRDKIFAPFQRIHHRHKYPGSGIGLAACRKMVEYHGGRIWFDSVPGDYTVFYFSIPVSAGAVLADAAR